MDSHQKWLLARQTGIGGSDIAAILGLSKYRTALHVYLSKVQPPESSDNERLQQTIGKNVEQGILNIYEERTQTTVDRFDDPILFRHPGVKHFVASYDGIVHKRMNDISVDRYVVDAKNVDASRGDEWGRDGSGIAPQDLVLQILWYQGIGDFPFGDLAALIGGRSFRIVTVERANDIIDVLQRRADEFWNNHVVKRIPPPAQAEHRYALEAVHRLYGKVVPSTAQLEPTKFLEKVLQEYFTGAALESAGKKLKRKSKTILMEVMGNADRAEIRGTGIELTRKAVHKNPYEVPEQNYIDLRPKLPKGQAKPMLEEAQKLITGMVTEEEDDDATSDEA